MPKESLSKGKRTRRAIEKAALALFLEQGYHATSMRQIAERAGIALSGIYNHFASKDEIFQELIIVEHPYLKILPIIQNAPGNSTEEFMRNSARAVQEEMGRNPDFIKLMFIEVVEFHGKHFPKLYETIFPQILPLLQRFAAPGSDVREIHFLRLVRAFMGIIIAFYVTEFLMSQPTLPPELRTMQLEDFMDIFLFGILKRENSPDL